MKLPNFDDFEPLIAVRKQMNAKGLSHLSLVNIERLGQVDVASQTIDWPQATMEEKPASPPPITKKEKAKIAAPPISIVERITTPAPKVAEVTDVAASPGAMPDQALPLASISAPVHAASEPIIPTSPQPQADAPEKEKTGWNFTFKTPGFAGFNLGAKRRTHAPDDATPVFAPAEKKRVKPKQKPVSVPNAAHTRYRQPITPWMIVLGIAIALVNVGLLYAVISFIASMKENQREPLKMQATPAPAQPAPKIVEPPATPPAPSAPAVVQTTPPPVIAPLLPVAPPESIPPVVVVPSPPAEVAPPLTHDIAIPSSPPASTDSHSAISSGGSSAGSNGADGTSTGVQTGEGESSADANGEAGTAAPGGIGNGGAAVGAGLSGQTAEEILRSVVAENPFAEVRRKGGQKVESLPFNSQDPLVIEHGSETPPEEEEAPNDNLPRIIMQP